MLVGLLLVVLFVFSECFFGCCVVKIKVMLFSPNRFCVVFEILPCNNMVVSPLWCLCVQATRVGFMRYCE